MRRTVNENRLQIPAVVEQKSAIRNPKASLGWKLQSGGFISESLDRQSSPRPTTPSRSDGLSTANVLFLHHPSISRFEAFEPSSSNQERYDSPKSRKRKLNLTRKVTTDLVMTYRNSCGNFKYIIERNPRRMLTKVSEPGGNFGFDNKENDLIVRVEDFFLVSQRKKYIVLDLLGQGTFGQVFRCRDIDTEDLVAVKVIKNHPRYYDQALMEVKVLKMLNSDYDPENKNHIVRLVDFFHFRGHLCLVFEHLSINLYELLTWNDLKGFPLSIVRGIIKQSLEALVLVGDADVIHCDLKPENILLESLENNANQFENRALASRLIEKDTCPSTKLIDFGSACLENQTVYSYIQSRFYRSPEVLLGLPYDGAIDLWSLGCISAELFLGLPLFPGVSDYDQLKIIISMLGCAPEKMLKRGLNVKNFFKVKHEKHESKELIVNNHDMASDTSYILKTPAEFAKDTNTMVRETKKYFKYSNLEDIIRKHGPASSLNHEVDYNLRSCFIHFLKGLLELDPSKRWTARQARAHPFISGEQFMGTFEPPASLRKQRTREPMREFSHEYGASRGWDIRTTSSSMDRIYGSHLHGPHSYPFQNVGDDHQLWSNGSIPQSGESHVIPHEYPLHSQSLFHLSQRQQQVINPIRDSSPAQSTNWAEANALGLHRSASLNSHHLSSANHFHRGYDAGGGYPFYTQPHQQHYPIPYYYPPYPMYTNSISDSRRYRDSESSKPNESVKNEVSLQPCPVRMIPSKVSVSEKNTAEHFTNGLAYNRYGDWQIPAPSIVISAGNSLETKSSTSRKNANRWKNGSSNGTPTSYTSKKHSIDDTASPNNTGSNGMSHAEWDPFFIEDLDEGAVKGEQGNGIGAGSPQMMKHCGSSSNGHTHSNGNRSNHKNDNKVFQNRNYNSKQKSKKKSSSNHRGSNSGRSRQQSQPNRACAQGTQNSKNRSTSSFVGHRNNRHNRHRRKNSEEIDKHRTTKYWRTLNSRGRGMSRYNSNPHRMQLANGKSNDMEIDDGKGNRLSSTQKTTSPLSKELLIGSESLELRLSEALSISSSIENE